MEYLVEDVLIIGVVSFIGWYIRQQFVKSTKKWDKTEQRLAELEKTVELLEYKIEQVLKDKL